MRDPVNERNSALYGFLRFICAIAFKTVVPVRYHRPEKAKLEPPFVIIGNHNSALDPAVLGFLVRKPQAVFLAKKVLDKNRFVHWFMIHMNVVFVDTEHTDLGAMRQCTKALKMGKALVIFPEGTRFHEGQMEHIQNGASLLILRNRVPVLPVYLDRKVRPFRRTHAWIGDPIPTEDLMQEGVNRDTCERLNERMRETFRALIRESEADRAMKKKGAKKHENRNQAS